MSQKVLKGADWVSSINFYRRQRLLAQNSVHSSYVALDVGYLDDRSFQDLRLQAEEVGRIIGGLRVSIARQRKISEVILFRTQHLGLRTLLKTAPGLNARISLGC